MLQNRLLPPFTCNNLYRSGTTEIPITQNLLKVIAVHFNDGEIIIGQRGMDPCRWIEHGGHILGEVAYSLWSKFEPYKTKQYATLDEVKLTIFRSEERMPQNTFIGRKVELGRLEESLKKAAAGQLQVAFIAGEAGAGKSSLVEKFIQDEQERDASLIASIGECNAHTGSGDPYLPFRQLLTSLTTDPEEKKSATETDSAKRTAQLKELARISGEMLLKFGPDLIGIFVPGAGLLTRIATEAALSGDLAHKLSEQVGKNKEADAVKVNPDLDQEKIFEQYASVLKALSKDRTLILVLDDLQWADSGSLNLLFHLARQCEQIMLKDLDRRIGLGQSFHFVYGVRCKINSRHLESMPRKFTGVVSAAGTGHHQTSRLEAPAGRESFEGGRRSAQIPAVAAAFIIRFPLIR
jgi:ABC-type transporter Mla MlaB component